MVRNVLSEHLDELRSGHALFNGIGAHDTLVISSHRALDSDSVTDDESLAENGISEFTQTCVGFASANVLTRCAYIYSPTAAMFFKLCTRYRIRHRRGKRHRNHQCDQFHCDACHIASLRIYEFIRLVLPRLKTLRSVTRPSPVFPSPW